MKLHPATKCRKEDWQVSSMTHWRWINNHDFPKPVKINGRNYYTDDQLQNEVANWFQRKFAE